MKLFFISFAVVIIMIGLEVCVDARQNDNNYRYSPNLTYSKQKTGNHTTNSLYQRTNSTANNYKNGYNTNYNNANTSRPGITPSYTTTTNTQRRPTNTNVPYQTPRPAVMTQSPAYYPAPGGYVPANYNYNYPPPSPALKQMPPVSYLPAGPTGYYLCHNHGQPITPFVYPVGYTGPLIANNPPSYSSYPGYNQPPPSGSYVQAAPIPYQQGFGYGQPNVPMSYVNTVPVRTPQGQYGQSVQLITPTQYVTGPHGQPCTFIFHQNVATLG